MSSNKQKLELTWIGKNNPDYSITNIEPRILVEQNELSYGEISSESLLIHGDNLLALKALLPEFEGKIKCIYIDPPYNTGNAFDHYDDSVEHSLWLNLMKPRIELLKSLLSDDGTIWVTLDDNEIHYFKVMCDEIFGRDNFLGTTIWQHSIQGKNDAKTFSLHHNYTIVYAKTENFYLSKLPREEKHNVNYSNPDNDPKGLWRSGDFRSPNLRQNLKFNIITPSGNIIPPPDKGWRWSKDKVAEKIASGEIIFSKDESKIIRKIYLSEQDGRVPETIWFGEDVGTTREANTEIKNIFQNETFATPKPERLIKRVLDIATKPGDFVLDSFLGSGTTAAVSQKMNRKWIGIEMGQHAYTHCKVRLDKVIDGSDNGGITEAVNWKGGGGYKFFGLAPSFVVIDEFGNPVIDSYYNDLKLIRAMCKLTNFTFAPSKTDYWKQGKGQGSNSIYVTTQLLTVALVQQIASHLGKNETLLICPKKFEPGCEIVDTRITIKKIPQSILKSCQFGKKEYLLPIKEKTIEEYDEEDFE